jgi:hypothetical protein
MTTFAEEIEAVAQGEAIEAIVIASEKSDHLGERSERTKPYEGKVISWATARPFLDYEYDAGFGGADCHAITAWTKTRVLFVHEYDGTTGISWLYRNPVNHRPQMSGQSLDDLIEALNAP